MMGRGDEEEIFVWEENELIEIKSKVGIDSKFSGKTKFLESPLEKSVSMK